VAIRLTTAEEEAVLAQLQSNRGFARRAAERTFDGFLSWLIFNGLQAIANKLKPYIAEGWATVSKAIRDTWNKIFA